MNVPCAPWKRPIGFIDGAMALLLALALIASGYAYLTLTNPLAWTAFISGLLLLLWVTGAGIATTIRHPAR